MSKPLKLYFDLMSQPSRALWMLLKLTKIPHEDCPVALRNGEHTDDKYKSINRFQKVPCIDDNGFKLSESIAIIRYLARKEPASSLLFKFYPQNDSKKLARIDEYLEWQHNNTRILCAMFFQLSWLIPIATGNPPNPDRVDEVKTLMEPMLDVIENVWLGSGTKYLAGDELTVADIWAACELEQPRMADYDPVVGRPKMAEWLKTVRENTNPLYDEAHKIVYKIIKSQNAKKSKL